MSDLSDRSLQSLRVSNLFQRSLLIFCHCLLPVLWCTFAAAEDEPKILKVELDAPIQTNQVTVLELESGMLELSTTGGDPYLVFPFPKAAKGTGARMLELTYFSTTGLESLETRLMREGRWLPPVSVARLPIAEGRSVAVLPLAEPTQEELAEDYSRIRIDLGLDRDCDLKIFGLELREMTADEHLAQVQQIELRKAKQEQASEITAYLGETEFSARVTAVAVGENKIRVQGTLPPSSGPFGLAELPLHEPTVAASRSVSHQIDASNTFEMELPRFNLHGEDRLTYRWQILEVKQDNPESGVPISPASWITHWKDLQPAKSTQKQGQLRNAKGLNGISSRFGLEELVELGIEHIMVNLVITDLLFEQEQPGAANFEYEGHRWWVREERLVEADRQIGFCTEHGISVGATVLIPQGSKDIIVHPAAQSAGIYAMPNFVDATAAQKYSALIRFFAERYSGNSGHGRVDHWIVHNEVDFAWQWTNMGEQPLELMLDHYHRSMRVLSLHTQESNPESDVFISLTHHFNPEHTDWKTYSARSILNLLSAFNGREGDFDWGVAHHPYPPSLFHPLRWRPEQVTSGFDSPMITMRNLQVLKQFLEQPHFLDKDSNRRTVLLSEQGYHTAGDAQSEALQAQALLYAWKRLRETDFVTAFDYHRWVDHPREGGLRLGLRTFPEPEKPAGRKKLGWQVYRDLGTEQEEEWRSKLEVEPQLEP